MQWGRKGDKQTGVRYDGHPLLLEGEGFLLLLHFVLQVLGQ